jgi:hypothetical protein
MIRHPVRRVIEKARCGGGTIIFDVDDLMTVARFATVELIDGIRTQGVDPLEVVRGRSLDLLTLLSRRVRLGNGTFKLMERQHDSGAHVLEGRELS